MLRPGHDSPSRKPRTARRRVAGRGRLAAIGSFAALAAFGLGGTLATATATATATGVTGATGDTTAPAGITTSTPDASTVPAPSVQSPAVEGSLIVTMTATPQVVTVGQTVTYTAHVSGVPAGKQVSYHWAFEGGTGLGEQISRTYPNPGDYPVAVTVTVASVAGLSGVADTLTVVVSNAPPAKVPGSGGSAGGGSGSGTGKGRGTGSGSSKSAAARARKRAAKAAAAQGVANPLARQAPSAQADQQVEGFLLTDAGAPFAPPVSTAPTSTSSSSGGSAAGSTGVGSAAGVGGGIALTIAIVTLGALDERRRISLRNA
ncbi:MAG TPA: PKD domain-containing protein [Solirubrobacteraceae bacterium]